MVEDTILLGCISALQGNMVTDVEKDITRLDPEYEGTMILNFESEQLERNELKDLTLNIEDIIKNVLLQNSF